MKTPATFVALTLLGAACDSSQNATTTSATSASSTAASSAASSTGAGGAGGAGVGAGGTGGAALPYPAFLPNTPKIINGGGPVLENPRFVAVTFQSDPMADAIEDFFKKVGGSPYWKTATSEYGVGAGTAGPPIRLAEAAPTDIDDDDIQTWLAAHLDGSDPAWGTADPETVYAVFYPETTTVTAKRWGKSCEAFGAYHWSTQQKNGDPLVYAVSPRCPPSSGMKPLDELTYALSHELLEASTDPLFPVSPAYGYVDNAHLIWDFFPVSEVGDMCAYEGKPSLFPADLGYTVARAWSSSAAKQGHSPCVPADPLVAYFNSVPAQDELIYADFPNGKVQTHGVKLAVGATRTIDVKLFSDQPTSAPWEVKVRDLDAIKGQPPHLALSLDRDHGLNGDTLKLTITLMSKAKYNLAGFVLLSSLGDERHVWTGAVGAP